MAGVAPGGRSVTWKLKRDVRWSDGVPFTADDVVLKNPQGSVITPVSVAVVGGNGDTQFAH